MICNHNWVEQERIICDKKNIMKLMDGSMQLNIQGFNINDIKESLHIIQKCTKCGKLSKLDVY